MKPLRQKNSQPFPGNLNNGWTIKKNRKPLKSDSVLYLARQTHQGLLPSRASHPTAGGKASQK